MMSAFDQSEASHANTMGRRRLLRSGGVIAAAAALMRPAAAQALPIHGDAAVKVTDLGPGVKNLSVMSGLLIGTNFYAGSRNVSPARVFAIDVSTAKVTATHMLGKGNFVEGLAADPTGRALFVGVTHTGRGDVNLYSIALGTGAVSKVVNVPGLLIRDLAMAPDGVLFITGRPTPHADGPPVYSWSSSSRRLAKVAVPEPAADEGSCLAATRTHVYWGGGSLLTGGNPKAGLFEINRATGKATRIPLPAELLHQTEICALAVFGHLLVLTTMNPGLGTPGGVGILDLGTRRWRVPAYTGQSLVSIARWGTYHFVVDGAPQPGLAAIDTRSLKVTRQPAGNAHRGSGWMGIRGNTAYGVVGRRFWSYDLAAKQGRVHDLATMGAAPGSMLGMSIATDGTRVYVAGTQAVDMHDLTTDKVTPLSVPGEVKDMLCVGSTLYMGVYSSQGIWRYRPGGTPARVARLPQGQNRPTDICRDGVNKLIGMTVKSDTLGGGSLCLYDTDHAKTTSVINPLGATQVPTAVAARGGRIYIGGSAGDIAMWDPLTRKQIWRYALPFTEGDQRRPAVTSILVYGNKLIGASSRSLFVISISARPTLLHYVGINAFTGAAANENPELVATGNGIYSVSAFSVVQINPVNYKLRLLLKDLGGDWYGHAHVASDPQHRLYTLSGRNLIQITTP
ncbi:hypothetical protein [Streptomyces sp. NPDC004629]|uniref:hypothetical protein n=1 Tax=Streptomyces sp. NPDC004629 TaxID=3364705 RepID=UPI00367D8701